MFNAEKLRNLRRWKLFFLCTIINSIKHCDHVFPAGGSISNMYAFLAARHKMFPGYKEQGLHSIKGQLVMYTSNQVRARNPFHTVSCNYNINCTMF